MIESSGDFRRPRYTAGTVVRTEGSRIIVSGRSPRGDVEKLRRLQAAIGEYLEGLPTAFSDRTVGDLVPAWVVKPLDAGSSSMRGAGTFVREIADRSVAEDVRT